MNRPTIITNAILIVKSPHIYKIFITHLLITRLNTKVGKVVKLSLKACCKYASGVTTDSFRVDYVTPIIPISIQIDANRKINRRLRHRVAPD